jgi:hypothetical protein
VALKWSFPGTGLTLAGKLGQENESAFRTFSCPNFPASLSLLTPFGNTDNLFDLSLRRVQAPFEK